VGNVAIDVQGVRVIYREFDRPRADLTVDTDEASAAEAATRIADAIDEWL
jgi:hypothetical protein